MSSSLFRDSVAPLDEADPFEVALRTAYEKLKAAFNESGNHQESMAQILVTQVKSSPENRKSVIDALIFGMIADEDEQEAKNYFSLMNLCVDDYHQHLTGRLVKLCDSSFLRLADRARRRIFWVFSVLVAQETAGIDQVGLSLLRSLRGDDSSEGNIFICAGLIEVFLGNRKWLYGNSLLISTAVYVFLRLITEQRENPELVTAQVRFCDAMLRERFLDCLAMGRDLIRALMDVSRIRQFDEILQTILTDPSRLCSSLNSVLQILSIPPHAKILACRMSVELENRLLFLMEHVPNGQQRSHQSWLAMDFLCGATSDFLVSDMIRYVVAAFHPSDALAFYNRVPRWAVVGWLLKMTKTYAGASTCKLSLFFDWFFYEEACGDSPLSLEPALQCMLNHAVKYREMTCSLVEFLYFIRNDFYPPISNFICDKVKFCAGVLNDQQGAFTKFVDALGTSFITELEADTGSKIQKILVDIFGEEFNFRDPVDKEVAPEPIIAPQQFMDDDLSRFLTGDLSLSEQDERLQRLLQEPTTESTLSQIAMRIWEAMRLEHDLLTTNFSRMENLFFIWKFLTVQLHRNPSSASTTTKLAAAIKECVPEKGLLEMLVVSLRVTWDDADLDGDPFCFLSKSDYLRGIFFFQEKYSDTFYASTPRIFQKFGDIVTGNLEFLHALFSDMDATRSLGLRLSIEHLIGKGIFLGSLEQAFTAFTASLDWESFEQIFFWKFVEATFDRDLLRLAYSNDKMEEFFFFFDDFLKSLSFRNNPEALSGMLQCLSGRIEENLIPELFEALFRIEHEHLDSYAVFVASIIISLKGDASLKAIKTVIEEAIRETDSSIGCISRVVSILLQSPDPVILSEILPYAAFEDLAQVWKAKGHQDFLNLHNQFLIYYSNC